MGIFKAVGIITGGIMVGVTGGGMAFLGMVTIAVWGMVKIMVAVTF